MWSCSGIFGTFAGWLIDRFVTLTCWAWFIFGFVFFFSVPYTVAAFLGKDSQTATQRLNSLFTGVLFAILRILAPSHTMHIDPDVTAIRSSVILCNHLSYLDPLLLITTFPRHRTIVKPRFFGIPIFRKILTQAGYIPASGEGRFARLMLQQIESMPSFLQSGGNLFVFPEGTRKRNGSIGSLHPGALKIARLCKAPMYVLRVQNTAVLFPPGKFVFNSRQKNTIRLSVVGCIRPDYEGDPPSAAALEQEVVAMYERGNT